MNSSYHLLVVDDDQAHRAMLRTLVGGWGYRIHEADDGASAVAAVKKQSFDLILMDIRMINLSGLEALGQIKVYNPAIPIVIMTAYSSVETAVAALKQGAYDYLTKPLDFDKLKVTIRRAIEHLHLRNENRQLRQRLQERFDRQRIVGNSAAMQELLDTVVQVAASEATVMIFGESGTGKELIAEAVHYNSPRKGGPLIKLNCAALTETLLDSELFGHEKGAFTGAQRRKEGCFVQADKGSIFLDEVSEMPLTMQVKLLRVLQERELIRVGGEEVVKVDVRVIVATNKNLSDIVGAGTFREDLYYRLNVVNLQVPPLRSRKEDIPLLAKHFLDRYAEKNRKPVAGFTPRAMDRLLRYDWPGNVRELMNTIERGVVLCTATYLDVEDFAMQAGKRQTRAAPIESPLDGDASLPLEAVEKAAIIRTLNATAGNKSEAARRLGITRKTLHKKLKKYGVSE
jgi:two-component system response regulator HydG